MIVPLPGRNGKESAGVVDLLAIRRDHRTKNRIIKRGDLFEIILIQVRAGSDQHFQLLSVVILGLAGITGLSEKLLGPGLH